LPDGERTEGKIKPGTGSGFACFWQVVRYAGGI